MTELNPAQCMWLESVLKAAFTSDSSFYSIEVRPSAESEFAIAIRRDESGQYLLHEPDVSPVHASAEESIQRLLDCLQTGDSILWVDDGAQPVLHRAEKGKVIREVVEKAAVRVKTPEWAIGKAKHLPLQQSAPLLQAIGLMTAEGEIRAPMRKKFRQVNHFLELMTPVLKSFGRNELVTLVDCGCGKSYLGLTLYWYLRTILRKKARLVGIDGSSHVISRCREQVQQIGLPDTTFICSRIQDAVIPNDVTMLVSLHACDTATDEALAAGIASHAKHILVVPCCQHELAKQISGVPEYPITTHRLFTHRFADLLTDMARSLVLEANGYSVTVGEFVSHEDTPKNLMLRAVKDETVEPDRLEQYEAFKQHYGIYPSIDWMLQMRENGVSA